MPCFYCGKRVSLVRQLTDADFCSDEHRKRYHELTRMALNRLMEAHEQLAAAPKRKQRAAAAAAATTPQPAAVPTPQPAAAPTNGRSAPAPIQPPAPPPPAPALPIRELRACRGRAVPSPAPNPPLSPVSPAVPPLPVFAGRTALGSSGLADRGAARPARSAGTTHAAPPPPIGQAGTPRLHWRPVREHAIAGVPSWARPLPAFPRRYPGPVAPQAGTQAFVAARALAWPHCAAPVDDSCALSGAPLAGMPRPAAAHEDRSRELRFAAPPSPIAAQPVRLAARLEFLLPLQLSMPVEVTACAPGAARGQRAARPARYLAFALPQLRMPRSLPVRDLLVPEVPPPLERTFWQLPHPANVAVAPRSARSGIATALAYPRRAVAASASVLSGAPLIPPAEAGGCTLKRAPQSAGVTFGLPQPRMPRSRPVEGIAVPDIPPSVERTFSELPRAASAVAAPRLALVACVTPAYAYPPHAVALAVRALGRAPLATWSDPAAAPGERAARHARYLAFGLARPRMPHSLPVEDVAFPEMPPPVERTFSQLPRPANALAAPQVATCTLAAPAVRALAPRSLASQRALKPAPQIWTPPAAATGQRAARHARYLAFRLPQTRMPRSLPVEDSALPEIPPPIERMFSQLPRPAIVPAAPRAAASGIAPAFACPQCAVALAVRGLGNAPLIPPAEAGGGTLKRAALIASVAFGVPQRRMPRSVRVERVAVPEIERTFSRTVRPVNVLMASRAAANSIAPGLAYPQRTVAAAACVLAGAPVVPAAEAGGRALKRAPSTAGVAFGPAKERMPRSVAAQQTALAEAGTFQPWPLPATVVAARRAALVSFARAFAWPQRPGMVRLHALARAPLAPGGVAGPVAGERSARHARYLAFGLPRVRMPRSLPVEDVAVPEIPPPLDQPFPESPRRASAPSAAPQACAGEPFRPSAPALAATRPRLGSARVEECELAAYASLLPRKAVVAAALPEAGRTGLLSATLGLPAFEEPRLERRLAGAAAFPLAVSASPVRAVRRAPESRPVAPPAVRMVKVGQGIAASLSLSPGLLVTVPVPPRVTLPPAHAESLPLPTRIASGATACAALRGLAAADFGPAPQAPAARRMAAPPRPAKTTAFVASSAHRGGGPAAHARPLLTLGTAELATLALPQRPGVPRPASAPAQEVPAQPAGLPPAQSVAPGLRLTSAAPILVFASAARVTSNPRAEGWQRLSRESATVRFAVLGFSGVHRAALWSASLSTAQAPGAARRPGAKVAAGPPPFRAPAHVTPRSAAGARGLQVGEMATLPAPPLRAGGRAPALLGPVFAAVASPKGAERSGISLNPGAMPRGLFRPPRVPADSEDERTTAAAAPYPQPLPAALLLASGLSVGCVRGIEWAAPIPLAAAARNGGAQPVSGAQFAPLSPQLCFSLAPLVPLDYRLGLDPLLAAQAPRALSGVWRGASSLVKAMLGGSGLLLVSLVLWGAASDPLRQTFQNRAAIHLEEDFRSELHGWFGGRDWSRNWVRDAAGFVRVGQLALYRPSMPLSDYRLEFLGQIKDQSLGWAFRASDLQNYYAMRLLVVRPGPLPTLALDRYTVIGGQPEQHVQVPIRLVLESGRPYHVLVNVLGNGFTTLIEGKVVDFWSDDRLKAGGAGFFGEREDRAHFYWMKLSHQDDLWGKVCALVAPGGDAFPSRDQ